MFRKMLMLTAVLSAALTLAGAALPASAYTPGTIGATGYDVSWPQCYSDGTISYTPPAGFAILGTNGGRPNTTNNCLAGEIAGAVGNSYISYYQNTANPGPRSTYWPAGSSVTKADGTTVNCLAEKRYTADSQQLLDCTYVYGWLSAQRGYDTVPSTNKTPTTQWWLDVESANSWMSDVAANIRDLQGAVDFLSSKVGKDNVGIYTNRSSWASIAGGNKTVFLDYPWWAPGYATSAQNAPNFCSAQSVTGGHLRYLQWVDSGVNLDKNYDCG